jgi:hypothetical protein
MSCLLLFYGGMCKHLVALIIRDITRIQKEGKVRGEKTRAEERKEKSKGDGIKSGSARGYVQNTGEARPGKEKRGGW